MAEERGSWYVRAARVMAAAPLLCPALAMLAACAAQESSVWWWAVCAFCILLPCAFKVWPMSILGCALSLWAGGHLFLNERSFDRITPPEGLFAESGSVYAVNGKSALFRPDNSPWFYTVSSPEGVRGLLEGEKYRIKGTCYPLTPPSGPGGFDRARWGYLNGIAAGVRLDQSVHEGPGDWKSRCLAASTWLRERAGELLRRGAAEGDDARQVMVSAVLGDKSDAKEETINQFLKSGCMHVFAVSGMHVGIAAMLILVLLRWLRLRASMSHLLCLLILAFYVFVTGMSVSALRAFIMVAVWLLAAVLRRKRNAANILALAFIVLCALDPLQVFQPGFQLSFCVYALIVFCVQWLNREAPLWAPDPFIPHRIYTFREKFMVWGEKTVRCALLISVGAWIISIPLTIWHFGTWNLYAACTNLCLTPLVPMLMGVSLFGLAFAWCPWILSVCNTVAAWFAGGILAVTQFFAGLPCSYLTFRPPAGDNEALVIPLQQGGWSVVVSNPGLIVDAGTAGAVRYTLLPALQSRGFQPCGVVQTRSRKPEQEGLALLKQELPGLRDWGRAGLPDTPGKWIFGPGNQLTVPPLPPPLATGLSQDTARVMLWSCRGRHVLLIGNAGFSSLARASQIPQADVLIIGHHPRDPVKDRDWMKKTGARTIIFTTEYHCPTPEGASVYKLPETGTLYLKAEPAGISVKPWKDRETRTK